MFQYELKLLFRAPYQQYDKYSILTDTKQYPCYCVTTSGLVLNIESFSQSFPHS